MAEIENFLRMFSDTHRRSLAARPPVIGLEHFDRASAAIVQQVYTFETKAAAHRQAKKDERLGPVGLRDALRAAADEVDGYLQHYESNGVVADLIHRQTALRASLAKPAEPVPTRHATVADLREVMAHATQQQLLYTRVAQLSAAERRLLFANSKDPTVLEVLANGPALIKLRNGIPFSEPLIPAEEIDAVRLAKARIEQPALAQHLDEVTAQVDALTSMLAQARDRIGLAVREVGDGRSGVQVLTGGSAAVIHGPATPENPDGVVSADDVTT